MKLNPVAMSLLLCASLGACGTARCGEPHTKELEISNPSLANGERVFYEYCHQCHAGGEASLAPALNNKPLPAWLMRFQVRHGFGAMPAFSDDQIDAREMEDLLAYLLVLRRHPSG